MSWHIGVTDVLTLVSYQQPLGSIMGGPNPML